jgi:O-succinylhomoserine sulfhydrylase
MSNNQQINFADWQDETLAIRYGYHPTQEGEHGEAMILTSSFVYDSAAQAAARFSGAEPGNIYSRFTNPTVGAFERRLAALEGAEMAVATSSGMAAILTACMGLLNAGDHVVCSRSVFGATQILFANHLSRFGIQTTFVDLTDNQAWQDAIQATTRLFFLETPSNPLMEVGDIAGLCAIAHAVDALVMVDNCLMTPVLQKPLALGADIVIHSATKFIDGQGRALGGAVLGSKALMAPVYGFLRTTGATMSAFNAWVFLKGLETLALRMKAQSEQALAVAQWLEAHERVEEVFYPGLASHPQAALVAKQQSAGGAVLSFRVTGGREEAWKVIDAVQVFSRSANLGDVKSIITHPATTTHGRVAEADRLAAGITENLIRLSIGLESLTDLKADLARGLEA